MTDGNNVTFDTAVGLANDKMLAVNDFTCFIDVVRSVLLIFCLYLNGLCMGKHGLWSGGSSDS